MLPHNHGFPVVTVAFIQTYMLGPKLQQAGGFPSNDASNKCQNWFPIIASVHQDNG
jgi:hypothetical protein